MPPENTSASGHEFEIIRRHFQPLAEADAGALSLNDDAAVLDIPEGRQLVVTTDALVAGVHFLADAAPDDIAHKVVGVNLSDLAAMGAQPRAVFLAAQFTTDTDEAWIGAFASGLKAALSDSGAALMGGDTVSTPGPAAFTLTAIGHVAAGQALTRSGAQPGDELFVTGTIGDGALGLLCATGGLPPDDELLSRYARPRPRTAFGVQLAERGLAHACIDISDGLAADVAHLCAASRVDAHVEASLVPLSDGARAAVEGDPARLATVLTGGDDYELAFAVAPDAVGAVAELADELGVAATRIGRFEVGEGALRVLDASARPMDLGPGGYRHL